MKVPKFFNWQGKGQENEIYGKILHGYSRVTYINILMVVFSILLLLMVRYSYGNAMDYQKQQSQAQAIITAHYQWLDSLNTTILTGEPFTGSLDPKTCSLGKWINSAAPHEMGDGAIDAALKSILKPHEDLHASASTLIELSKRDKNAALKQYTAEVKPRVGEIARNLNIISDRYQVIAENKPFYTNIFVFVAFLVYIGLAVFVGSQGPRIAKGIADPIEAVARWAKALTHGVSNAQIEAAYLEKTGHTVEIDTMIESLTVLAEDIRQHAKVIAKIAQGDLTHYVDIKSSEDVLGKSLYHLVQNNDMMFSDLLKIADTVAVNANSIALANQSLAQSATEQASAVEQLSETVKNANALALENSRKAGRAKEFTDEIKADIRQDLTKMELMVTATDEVRMASEKISAVMKTIDDIAYQTNLLALNASIEAAHAGEVGKGFAVVANEVRELATKSAAAASQTKLLIEDTMGKTEISSKISREASETFHKIVDSADQIAEVVVQIADSSDTQRNDIARIHEEIHKISEVVAGNAAISEETAAATQEMNDSADIIKKSMQKFNLRHREDGKAYIPPEKSDDQNFIQQAQSNYIKAQAERILPN